MPDRIKQGGGPDLACGPCVCHLCHIGFQGCSEREISLNWVKQKIRKYFLEEMIYELSLDEGAGGH